MTKSDLMMRLVAKKPTRQFTQVDNCIKEILEQIISTLEAGQRVEFRGFGSFSLHHRESRIGRNPKSGESVTLSAKSVPHFKAGKALKERVDLIHS